MLGCAQEEAVQQMELLIEEVTLSLEPPPAATEEEASFDLFDEELRDEISAMFSSE